MNLTIRRVIYFTRRMEEMTMFYRDVLGLKLVGDDPKFKDFESGGVSLSLHGGNPAATPPKTKLAFFTDDVSAARDELIKRGAKMGKLIEGDGLTLCDGADPDGNPYQLSNRK